ncbi:MAG: hypothetical protein KJ597_05230, partial [Nanoarchaeota archaeon]|nr:hypothetical protein [Nanoarchaeota archaeon]
VGVLLAVGIIFYLKTDTVPEKNAESQEALIEMKNLYGNCSPTVAKETTFESDIVQEETVEEKEDTKNEFIEEIERCKKSSHLAVCAANGCKWNGESS